MRERDILSISASKTDAGKRTLCYVLLETVHDARTVGDIDRLQQRLTELGYGDILIVGIQEGQRSKQELIRAVGIETISMSVHTDVIVFNGYTRSAILRNVRQIAENFGLSVHILSFDELLPSDKEVTHEEAE